MRESGDTGLGPRWPEALSSVAAELDALFRRNPYLRSLGAEVDDWGLGWARTRVIPKGEGANIMGTVHGGIVVGLADAAFEIACNSYGRRCVAIDINAHFLAVSEVGEPLVAETREVARSARIASYRIDVSKEGSGADPVVSMHALAYRTEGWHLGAERYPDDWRNRY
jgi:acyl-CoA thioesterase